MSGIECVLHTLKGTQGKGDAKNLECPLGRGAKTRRGETGKNLPLRRPGGIMNAWYKFSAAARGSRRGVAVKNLQQQQSA
jgi:hypothetical protein